MNSTSLKLQNILKEMFVKDGQEIFDTYSSQPNYEIIVTDPASSYCAIYFSSHGIYGADDFHERIIKKNRYDWKRNLLPIAGKHIFVRDVLKQWYVSGINAHVNSPEKLFEFLKNETSGKLIITVGSSAGAYASVLYGSLLGAEYVFAFSPQFNLKHHIQACDRLANEYVNGEGSYISIVSILESAQVPIFYFYGGKSEQDIKQANLVKDIESVYQFMFDTDVHGAPMFIFDLTELFQKNILELKDLAVMYSGKMITRTHFSIKLNGWIDFLNKGSRFTYQYLQSKLNSSKK